jgi:hypothetical protein
MKTKRNQPPRINQETDRQAMQTTGSKTTAPMRLTIEELEERLAPTVGWGCGPTK